MAEDILERIAEATRDRVAKAKAAVPLATVAEKARAIADGELAAADGQGFSFPFAQALSKPGLSFICEVKKASPSKGIIADEFDPLAIARDYEQAGADAISCLTEPQWFLGSDEYLEDIAAAVSIPVLRKDFIVDEYMIHEAKCLGASAVLLICSILDDESLRALRELAESLGLSALVEAHDEEEVRRALAAGSSIIGVNNRNLRDFSVDFGNAQNLRALIPPSVLYVAESGVMGPADAASIARTGADAALVGEALMRSPHKARTLASFRRAAAMASAREASQPSVKFCGLTSVEDCQGANEAGPGYAGFVFWEQSRRHVSPSQAKALRDALDPSIVTVGVFVDADPELVADLYKDGVIAVAQLHGTEDATYIEGLRSKAPGIEVWKAFEVNGSDAIVAANESPADMVLLDAGKGCGQSFDWDLLETVERPFILAGGLDPEAVATLGEHLPKGCMPQGLDSSSGIEAPSDDDGTVRKNAHAMRGFMDAARSLAAHGR